MKTRLLSVLLVFLLIASVSIPAVSAEPSNVYYELHNLCFCEKSEDLGHIPHINWGIGYSSRMIDQQNDKWRVFIHAGFAKKEFIVTKETDKGKLIALMDFVKSVNTCKTESDQLSPKLIGAISAGVLGSLATMKGLLKDDAFVTMSGIAGFGFTVEEVHQFVTHFNNAKTAQLDAEKLFDAL